ncbi:Small ribosomal subunit protein mS31 [Caenorhabditis elegans]|uniref:Small ribosomal subunit protein mS31 n=1 Tax=Caenorhabditis elegans TaxID=6239 RepID=RT31_CAEEL|nr:Small ribosomal subunit protein mS31 [Caenorhabditis elegans]Q09261.2 RecName: Full=Small ribosomal subunit protein mS31; AltName: Full=28S ribosomal protein S31, mitochondrial; Short=MRP-S31; Short=S31mt; Flags: Precursor [Caenorhabditis elegans]CAA88285.2 Small ribosomal subunit protein mS31 [Caenorhabditis elegans]|eukprot:NP_497736.2 28S ribosomal protein S31, mitochondrial [Caenorhabditis elegans]
MLRSLCSIAVRLGGARQPRLLSSAASGDGNDGKGAKDAIDEDLLNAIEGVANNIHPQNGSEKKSLKNTLINRLVANEKASFDAAAASASSEMLDDQALIGLLADVAGDAKVEKKLPPKSAQLRQEKRGLVLLRKEIFYQAVQSGFTTEEARVKSETIVNEAQIKLQEQRKALLNDVREKVEQEEVEETERSEKDQKLFTMALEFMEKIYKDDLISSAVRKPVKVDNDAIKLFNQKPLGIWKKGEKYEDFSLGFWKQWDERAARISNGSFGPTNSFEEQIEWTTKGKQWEYPIDNEFKMGDESNVSFIDHVFLERHLPSLGIPKSGPIAHFMHLVCVGLSKNPYMTAAKKREHLKWFADYFNTEKQKLVHKLHEQEQIAAQNAL